jgi:nucleotide-binding universal stress UspA family protein
LTGIKVRCGCTPNNRSTHPELIVTFKSLLLYLDDHPHAVARTQAAIRLAGRLDIHLVGLAPTGLLDLPATPAAAAALADFAATAWNTLRHRAEHLAERFQADCRDAGLASFEAVVDEADPLRSLLRHACTSDLTVLTQPDPAASDYRATRDRVESVAIHSARPTLVLPHACRADQLGTSVLVAWDGSRESARAAADALPLLQAATVVTLATWCEAGGRNAHHLRAELDAAQRWLARHGVAARVRVEGPTAAIAESIRASAADAGADLIVMGAYGHTRLVERILGGATRGLMQSMPAPVLMSH